MKIEIEIPDEELREILTKAIADRLYDDFSYERNIYTRTIAECVRDVIYKDKANIVEMVVARASRECRSKAIKQILEEAYHAQE